MKVRGELLQLADEILTCFHCDEILKPWAKAVYLSAGNRLEVQCSLCKCITVFVVEQDGKAISYQDKKQ